DPCRRRPRRPAGRAAAGGRGRVLPQRRGEPARPGQRDQIHRAAAPTATVNPRRCMMLDSLVERARAVLTSIVTIISALMAVVLLAADEIVTWGLPEQVEGPVVTWLVRVAVLLAGV